MQADQDGRADRAGLDQALPAQRQQAAADKDEIRRGKVPRHLAHRIAQHDIRRQWRLHVVEIQRTATLDRKAHARRDRRHFVEAL